MGLPPPPPPTPTRADLSQGEAGGRQVFEGLRRKVAWDICLVLAPWWVCLGGPSRSAFPTWHRLASHLTPEVGAGAELSQSSLGEANGPWFENLGGVGEGQLRGGWSLWTLPGYLGSTIRECSPECCSPQIPLSRERLPCTGNQGVASHPPPLPHPWPCAVRAGLSTVSSEASRTPRAGPALTSSFSLWPGWRPPLRSHLLGRVPHPDLLRLGPTLAHPGGLLRLPRGQGHEQESQGPWQGVGPL